MNHTVCAGSVLRVRWLSACCVRRSRVPYITTIRTGVPSIIPAVRNIHNNFILATYFSQQAIDTDDGSAYYEVYDNFFAYGDNGLKSDFGGHDNKWHGNVLAYVGNCYHMWSFKGYNDAFYGNQCIYRQSYGSDCGCVRKHLPRLPRSVRSLGAADRHIPHVVPQSLAWWYGNTEHTHTHSTHTHTRTKACSAGVELHRTRNTTGRPIDFRGSQHCAANCLFARR